MVIKNIIFLYPELFCLILLPLIICFFVKNRPKKNQVAIFFPQLKLLQKSYQKKGNSKSYNKSYYLRWLLLYIIWILMVIALTQPNIIKKHQEAELSGYDLMLLIDSSGSMEALDFATKSNLKTRLDVSKEVISAFVKERHNDRLGLIIFGKFAYLASPLTVDKVGLNSILNNIYIGIAGQETAIGDAIALALKKLHKKKKSSRAIILLTDGENTAGTIKPIQAAKLAQTYDIPIYIIAIGSNGKAPFLDNYGNLQYGYVTLDVTTLKHLAKLTKGKYFNAQNKTELKNIYTEINKLTASKAKSYLTIEYQPIFFNFLILALVIFIFILMNNIKFIKK
jgi:Ca-activated chloride channel family protein